MPPGLCGHSLHPSIDSVYLLLFAVLSGLRYTGWIELMVCSRGEAPLSGKAMNRREGGSDAADGKWYLWLYFSAVVEKESLKKR